MTGPSGARGAQPPVRVAAPPERGEIADALAAAFFDDPVMSWIFPGAADRSRRLRLLFGVLLKGHYLPLGTVWTTDGHTGAALWAAPGHGVIPARTTLRHLGGALRALGLNAARALRALTHVERLHPKEPHWYLGVLGTRPEFQGRGIGSALLVPVLERCDAEGLPAYLESSKESNLAFYGRHGFEITAEVILPGGGPPVWPMWRTPVPS